MRGVGSGLAIAALSAGVASASSLDTLESFLKSTKSGRADFTQVVTSPAKAGQTTVRSKTSTGQFSFVRPTRFRFDYVKPFPQVIVADGQTLWLYDADLEQVTARKQTQALGSTPAALVATAADLSALQKEFTLDAQPDADGLQWVQATPKNRESTIQSVRMGLRVDGVQVSLGKLEIFDAMGQRSVLSFERFEVNPANLGAAQFNFVTPKGVSVIRP
ncbi:outer membrane lipoprotein carrier protein LolA [Limnohabitans sp. Rim8]|uniref:outer membrane lipoprotein chaperone LolA n=1 Tax=Limnohabitans sp. Rim8 TaxID=1100718 RepID=UPI000D352225|nr:outer membrane lipoprotein chaperone LolA [Limnohabitans sp. Rim8]PUE62405.1 outer membrane lipoprotein carrier protein LolA [Limnohabitans sp. Rim8]